jgi:hypothetical protein
MGMSTTEAPASPATAEAYRVAVLSPGDGPKAKPRYLGYQGRLHRLKIYINLYTKEQAEKISKEINAENPGFKASASRYKDGDGLLTALIAKKG